MSWICGRSAAATGAVECGATVSVCELDIGDCWNAIQEAKQPGGLDARLTVSCVTWIVKLFGLLIDSGTVRHTPGYSRSGTLPAMVKVSSETFHV
jgi:hypothetical protein